MAYCAIRLVLITEFNMVKTSATWSSVLKTPLMLLLCTENAHLMNSNLDHELIASDVYHLYSYAQCVMHGMWM